jgi:hypothetical protein
MKSMLPWLVRNGAYMYAPSNPTLVNYTARPFALEGVCLHDFVESYEFNTDPKRTKVAQNMKGNDTGAKVI